MRGRSGGFWIVMILLLIFGWAFMIVSCAENPDDNKGCESPRYESSCDRNYHTASSSMQQYATEPAEVPSSQADRSGTGSTDNGNYSGTKQVYNDGSEYNVNDYDDPEDFYEDNQDEFEDEEDAEDYYDENHE